jgi:hypothetical protein
LQALGKPAPKGKRFLRPPVPYAVLAVVFVVVNTLFFRSMLENFLTVGFLARVFALLLVVSYVGAVLIFGAWARVRERALFLIACPWLLFAGLIVYVLIFHILSHQSVTTWI